MDFNSAVNEVATAIANTTEFNQYRSLRQQIRQDQQLGPLLAQFEAKQRQLYTTQLTQDKAQQLMAELDKDYATMNTYPLMKQYFAAGEKVNQLTQNIMQNIDMLLEKRLQ